MQKIYKSVLEAKSKEVFFRNVFEDPLVKKFINLTKELANCSMEALPTYYEFVSEFIPAAYEKIGTGNNVWEQYVVHLILEDDNFYTRLAERTPYKEIPEAINKIAGSDLSFLQVLARVNIEYLISVLAKQSKDEYIPNWDGMENNRIQNRAGFTLAKLLDSSDWQRELPLLSNYYKEQGVGLFGRYHAFRWVHNNKEAKMTGVKNLDSIKFEQLYEYEEERKIVVENTERLLAGLPANNILLYGDRGTGKSSTVKALINKYGAAGLRLVEIQKQDLQDFPLVVSYLAEKIQKCIIFIDDLSFGEEEYQYKELKALLEGGLEAKPDNVLIYATSNRRHLIKESFADKEPDWGTNQEDVRFMDTLQEKMSLADRFGITVVFAAPDQKKYLAIVEKLAQERGLFIPREDLIQQALRWEIRYNARSGRTAKQFIDYLEGVTKSIL